VKSLEILRNELRGVSAGPNVEAVFLAGYLESAKALAVPLATFDKAADEFKEATKVRPEVWTRFLAVLVDESRPAAEEAALRNDFVAYLGREVPAYRAAMQPAEPPPAVTREVTIHVAQDVWTSLLKLLTVKQYLPGYEQGAVLQTWQTNPVQVVADKPPDVFVVQFVNAEGGPVLLGMRKRDGAVVYWHKPSYDATAPFTFNVGGNKVVVHLQPAPPA